MSVRTHTLKTAIFEDDKEKLCKIILGLAWILVVSSNLTQIFLFPFYFQFKDDVAKRTDLATPHCDFISVPSWGLWSLCLCQQASHWMALKFNLSKYSPIIFSCKFGYPYVFYSASVSWRLVLEFWLLQRRFPLDSLGYCSWNSDILIPEGIWRISKGSVISGS